MRDHDPILLRRMFALRQFPILADGDLEELATVAENVVERSFARGERATLRGARPAVVHLVVAGPLAPAGGGRGAGPRELSGALEALAHRDARADVVAVEDTTVFELQAFELDDLLEDNHVLMVSALRVIARRVLAASPRRPSGDAPRVSQAELGLIDRLLVLKARPELAAAHLQALTPLAHACEEVRWAMGSTVALAGELAARSIFVVEGTLRAGGDLELARYGPGDAVGLLETFAGERHEHGLEAASPVRALVNRADDLLDAIEDHPDLGLAVLRTLSASLLDR